MERRLEHHLKEIENTALTIAQLLQDNRSHIKGTTSYTRVKLFERKLKYLATKVKNYGKKPIKKVIFNLTKMNGSISITDKHETYFVDIPNEDIKIALDIYSISNGYKVEILEIKDIPTHIRKL